jgi:hypothetical protein
MKGSYTTRRAFATGSVTGLVGVLAGCVSPATIANEETRTERRTYEVDSRTRLRVDNRNGAITVDVHDGENIEADVAVRGPSRDVLRALSVTDDRAQGGLELATEYRGGSERRASAAITVRVPTNVRIERIRTRNGLIDVDVPTIADDTEIRTRNGSIDAALATDLDATVSATTINGSVEHHGLDLSSAESSRTSVSGSLGTGARDLSFETHNGSSNSDPFRSNDEARATGAREH